MSLVLELEVPRKAGRVCDRSYRNGENCPLILRQTSEDLLTATVFGTLRNLSPRFWLIPMMRTAFPGSAFHASEMRDLRLHFWAKLQPPRERTGTEGLTEVDLLIQFAKRSIFVEAKYLAQLATRTANDPTRDQLSRLVDVARWYCGEEEKLFANEDREPFVLVIGLSEATPWQLRRLRRQRGQQSAATLAGVHAPSDPHVGYLSWMGLARVLLKAIAGAPTIEARFLGDVVRYLRHKTQIQQTPGAVWRVYPPGSP